MEQRGLFVRLPAAAAEKLDRASFELKTPKRELVAGLVERHLGLTEAVVGRAAVSGTEPDVLTVEQLARLLQVDEKSVRSLAASGDIPGRKIGRHWRFSRSFACSASDACTWTSTPIRSMRAQGPRGQPAPFVIALSMSSGDTSASSRTRTQSFRSGIRMRLTMKPGVSWQVTGCLPARSAHS